MLILRYSNREYSYIQHINQEMQAIKFNKL